MKNNIWKLDTWKTIYSSNIYRTGLRVRYEKNVDCEVKRSCKEFVSWLRTQYSFPIRVYMYIKSQKRIKAMDKTMVCGTFFRPFDKTTEPYIRIATGDYLELVENRGVDNALASILFSIAHELTHYFQWLNHIELTHIGEERQASRYADQILMDYAGTRDHP